MQRLAFRKIFNQFSHISYLLVISFTTKFELQKYLRIDIEIVKYLNESRGDPSKGFSRARPSPKGSIRSLVIKLKHHKTINHRHWWCQQTLVNVTCAKESISCTIAKNSLQCPSRRGSRELSEKNNALIASTTTTSPRHVGWYAAGNVQGGITLCCIVRPLATILVPGMNLATTYRFITH